MLTGVPFTLTRPPLHVRPTTPPSPYVSGLNRLHPSPSTFLTVNQPEVSLHSSVPQTHLLITVVSVHLLRAPYLPLENLI